MIKIKIKIEKRSEKVEAGGYLVQKIHRCNLILPEKYHHHLDDAPPVFCHDGDPSDPGENDLASVEPGEDVTEGER